MTQLAGRCCGRADRRRRAVRCARRGRVHLRPLVPRDHDVRQCRPAHRGGCAAERRALGREVPVPRLAARPDHDRRLRHQLRRAGDHHRLEAIACSGTARARTCSATSSPASASGLLAGALVAQQVAQKVPLSGSRRSRPSRCRCRFLPRAIHFVAGRDRHRRRFRVLRAARECAHRRDSHPAHASGARPKVLTRLMTVATMAGPFGFIVAGYSLRHVSSTRSFVLPALLLLQPRVAARSPARRG